MKDTHPTTKPKLTLDQLLSVKRAERPDSAFWAGFDQEFRRRQLASLVSRQPWQVRLGRLSLLLLRKTAPAAATAAALALGFVVYNGQSTAPASINTALPDDSSNSRLVVLPEEQFSTTADVVSQPANIREPDGRVRPRFATLELNSTASQSRNFTTVTSPFAFAAASSDSGMYVVNDLTAGPVMRTPTPPVGNL